MSAYENGLFEATGSGDEPQWLRDEPFDWSKTAVGNYIIAMDDSGEVGRWRITEVTGPGKFKIEPVSADG